jgi:membrane protease YdiL (CAAX protease family)
MTQTGSASPPPLAVAAPGTAADGARGTRGLLAFFVLAFGITWALWVPAGLSARGALHLPVPALALVVVGGFGPLLAAVLTVSLAEGRQGVRSLLAQLDPRGVPRRWFLVTLVLVPLNLVPVAGHLVTGGPAPSSQTLLGAVLVFPVQLLFVAAVGGGLDEEVGWRGYALPRMLRTSRPAVAHAVLGVVWSCWHLPLWLDPTSSQSAYPFGVYLVSTTGLSVLIGWMYAASGGSLAVAVLAHAVSNSSDRIRYEFLGDDKGKLAHQLTAMVVLALAAAVVAWRTRGRLGADRLPTLPC